MAYIVPRARMSHVNSIWLERRLRPDAYRFGAPGTAEAKTRLYLHPSAARAEQAAKDQTRACAAAEQDAFEHEMLAPRRELASLKLDDGLRRFQRKYSP